MKKCYLITTAHLEDGLWFLDDEDFRTGMNYVAIQATRSKVVVLAFYPDVQPFALHSLW